MRQILVVLNYQYIIIIRCKKKTENGEESINTMFAAPFFSYSNLVPLNQDWREATLPFEALPYFC